ncbi:MAG: T9SS type A sorting domain-containing protein [Bacteroidia bacterium]
MKNFLLVALLGISFLQAQTLRLRQIGTLPASLEESSGLEQGQNRTLWSHNDSGNDPVLFQIDSTGALMHESYIGNASNIDWEDIARDNQGYLYIGDFGNNGNGRQDLRILRVTEIDANNLDTVESEAITIRYADQSTFPPSSSQFHYDVEAFFWANDSLFLFSKNRTSPYDGWIYYYAVPDNPGDYIISRVDSFQAGGTQKENSWITAGDIREDGSRVALLSSDNIWLFSCYAGNRFFDGYAKKINLPTLTQKEAIVFVDKNRLHISDEKVFIIGGRVYEVDISSIPMFEVDLGQDKILVEDSVVLHANVAEAAQVRWASGESGNELVVRQEGEYAVEVNLNGCIARDTVRVFGPNTVESQADQIELTVGPNPFAQSISVQLNLPKPGPVSLILLDSAGKVAYRDRKVFTAAGSHKVAFRPLGVSAGTYQLVLTQGDFRVSGRVVKQ